MCRLRCAPASPLPPLPPGAPPPPRPRLRWHGFTFLPGPASAHGCSAYGQVLFLPRRPCLRLILLRTCPPLCVGALWPMPAWIWHDVRSVPFSFLSFYFYVCMCTHCQHWAQTATVPVLQLWCVWLWVAPASVLPVILALSSCNYKECFSEALWPMPAWVWRDVRFFFSFFPLLTWHERHPYHARTLTSAFL